VAVSAKLGRLEAVEYAEPDFVLLPRKHASQSAAAARLAVDQYCIRVTRTTDAWKLERANAKVRVAIIDDGVMVDHPDLRACLVGAFDATGGRGVPHPKPWDSHGTGCAGLAVGTNRGTPGVKGVAAGTGLLAVRIGYTPTREDNYVCKTSWLRRGIDWAWRQGAAVLSMSFGGGPPAKPVINALERARTKGRNGKGCVLVAAAGNAADSGEPVEFPASLPFVLGVGATNLKDRAQVKIDKTSPWVSKCGPEVDIGAPGVNNYTCTIPDPDEDENDLYFDLFSGTSAATPLVAGAAALVLSANPGLTEAEVRSVLCATADKVGPGAYHQGRNDQVGSGRLNVLRAVKAVGARKAPEGSISAGPKKARRQKRTTKST
jgi:subtilisin family serine protease